MEQSNIGSITFYVGGHHLHIMDDFGNAVCLTTDALWQWAGFYANGMVFTH